ncbi:MAG: MiaB/RimO family radical SAM methylthiotransferase [Patescibacteria group bacterium]|nr:MiaB/RimO family radical SAM methylthiotransferase [Patescibacteria group bacterium]
MKYFIKTFGCAANEADSERIAASYKARGFKPADRLEDADHIIINTCMVRESAENRVYGLVNNLARFKIKNCFAKQNLRKQTKLKIIVTGCMVGMAVRDKTGKMLKVLKQRLPQVDEFLPIEEVGFDYTPVRGDKQKALVPISNGCNNFCTFCIVPFTRGREISRPFEEIVSEVKRLAKQGYKEILLIGQNVNSYGADIIKSKVKNQKSKMQIKNQNFKEGKITFVKHLGRYRIPTLFPYLLDTLCKIKGIEKIDFISSNPWDFSDELINTIARNPKITRNIHLPVQSGDNDILKKMNRWYTREEYLELVKKLKLKLFAESKFCVAKQNLKLSTDIIVGFPGETKEQFENTVDLCRKVGFYKAYLAVYSDRPLTAAHKAFDDDVPYKEKKRRWNVLEKLINKK